MVPFYQWHEEEANASLLYGFRTMIPISTDAPIYRNPLASIAMIVLNSHLFFVLCRGPDPTFESSLIRTPDGRVQTTEQIEAELVNIRDEEQMAAFLEGCIPVEEHFLWKKTLSVEFGKIRPWQSITCNFMHILGFCVALPVGL
jgi:hypothetical protein